MPRFVILEHDHPSLHWDFMLEGNGMLRTWRLPRLPIGSALDMIVEGLSDHRLAYLDYEGPVSGDRGVVKKWDAGEYQVLDDTSPERLVVRLVGRRLRGDATLHRIGAVWNFHFQSMVGNGGGVGAGAVLG